MAVTPVLTAHPTEARRRTILVALRRCGDLLARMDDPRLTPSEDRDVRRRLREEITLLWRTSDLRPIAPAPLDEVRTAMAFFDATLFTLAPRLARVARWGAGRPVRWSRPTSRAPGDAAPAGPAPDRRGSGPSCAGAAGSAATATATRASPPTRPNGPSGSTPTTSCTATRPWRPG